ncbi:MAG: RNA polymerase sigma factor [Acidobacteriota bacterium]
MRRDDSELIERFLSGDPKTVETVDGWIRQAAWSFRTRLFEHWEDVLQDAHLELTRLLRTEQFRGDSSLKTYLWRVVNHACLDRVRALSRRSMQGLDGLEHFAPLTSAPLQGGKQELRDLLSRVLEQTSKDCQRLWRMVLDGYSYREMSRQTGVAEATLRVRVLRCRKRATEIRERILQESENGSSP